ncbi:MAG: prepilin peptidase [Candidatus Thorarchaeota archaeon]|nr:prepilin peptidase [Candidatus Thorarchaeota archaeon]
MVLVITASAIFSFTFATILLFIYSVYDLRTRKVPNQVMLVGAIVGLVIVTLSGHIVEQAMLHLTAVLVTLILGYVLFRIGSFGGADMKTIFTIAIISPGIEFASWGNPVLEAILVISIQLGVVLVSGYLISQRKTIGTEVVPLIPIIFTAYLVLQVLALL